MKRRVIVLSAALAALAVGVFAEGCRAPTQATVEVTTTAQCSELGDVAIVVSGAPNSSEDRAGRGFYAAQTSQCDASRSFGSLVVVPGESRAAVIVIAAPKGRSLSECTPPKYAGCIVARRAFGFIDNASLTVPVSLDIECRDVPCDAFTTCKKGVCLSAETSCDTPESCHLVGEAPDGGVLPDAEVFVEGGGARPDGGVHVDGGSEGGGADGGASDAGSDTGLPDGGTDSSTAIDGGGTDSGSDSSVVTPPPPNVMCSMDGGLAMKCGASGPCASTSGCCENVMAVDSLICTAKTISPCAGMVKGRQRYCCSDAWCAGYGDTTKCTTNDGGAGNCVLPP